IKETPEFKAILKRFEASRTPIIKSATAFTIHEKGLITEGLAFDPVEETFFVSSVHKRKILSVSKNGEIKPFASEQDGLFSVLGSRSTRNAATCGSQAPHSRRWSTSRKKNKACRPCLSSICNQRSS